MKTFNINEAYTLQSIKTGKYISSLFSDTHKEIFGTNNLTNAYTWSSIEHVTHLRDEIGQCIIIKIEE